MDARQRTLANRECKEQVAWQGVFRVDCAATGQTWVDATTTLDTIQNRVWFTLRMGSHRNRELQRVGADASDYAAERLLAEREAPWLEALAASPCL